MVEDDHDVIHFNNSSDLTLSTSLNDLDFVTLNIDGQLMDVEAPPDIIDVDKDDDFIDDEDGAPHDFVDSDGEVLANDDDDDDDMSASVAWGHGDDNGGNDPSGPSLRPIRIGKLMASNPDLLRTSSMKRRISMLTIGLTLSKLPEPFKMLKTRQRARSSASKDLSHLLSFKISKWRALRLESTRPSSRPSSTHTHGDKFAQDEEEMIRLSDLVPIRRRSRNVISINEPRYTHTDINVDEVKEDNKQLRKELTMLRTVIRSDERMSQLLTQLESQHKVGGGSGSGEGGDDEPGVVEDVNEDEESYDMLYMGKALVLSWGRTPRLDSGMRVSQILGFPSILLVFVSEPKWVPCLARVRNQSCVMDVNSLSRSLLGPQKICHVRLASSETCQCRPKGLVNLLCVIKSPSPVFLLHAMLLRTLGIAGLKFRHPSMPSSLFAVTLPTAQYHHYLVLLILTVDSEVRFCSLLRTLAEAEVDSIVRTFIPIMMSATTVTPTVDPTAISKKRHVGSSVLSGDSFSAAESHPLSGGFSDRTGNNFLVGGIRTVVDPNSNLYRIYVSQWNVTNRFCMDDAGVYREMVDEFPPNFFASIYGMEHDQLFTEFNVGVARQVSLSTEVRMYAEYNIKKKRRLKSVVEEKDSLLKSKCDEIEILKAQLIVMEAEAVETVHPQDEAKALRERNATLEKDKNELGVKVTDLAASVKVHKLKVSAAGLQEKVTVYEHCMSQLEKFQDEKLEEVNEKFDKLCVDFFEMALHLEEKFYPHLLTTISGRRCLLTHSMELAIVKCFNSTEYMSVLEAAITKAVEKGMLEGLSAGITHGAKGRKLADLMVPIHHSSNQRVIGAFALSLSLDVSHSRVRRIRENIANHVSALHGVFVPLFEPLSIAALEGTKGTFGSAHNTTTALSVTFVSASTILPNSTDDYEVAHADGQEGAGVGGEAVADENIDPFPDVSNVELNILE
nr:hypothetical protein [Tanacetum cinerariifolium]